MGPGVRGDRRPWGREIAGPAGARCQAGGLPGGCRAGLSGKGAVERGDAAGKVTRREGEMKIDFNVFQLIRDNISTKTSPTKTLKKGINMVEICIIISVYFIHFNSFQRI